MATVFGNPSRNSHLKTVYSSSSALYMVLIVQKAPGDVYKSRALSPCLTFMTLGHVVGIDFIFCANQA